MLAALVSCVPVLYYLTIVGPYGDKKVPGFRSDETADRQTVSTKQYLVYCTWYLHATSRKQRALLVASKWQAAVVVLYYCTVLYLVPGTVVSSVSVVPRPLV